MIMMPLRVTIRLKTPIVVSPAPMHLDGLLSWARVQEAEEMGSEDPIALQHDIPLERYGSGDAWCFKASWFQMDYLTDPRPLHYIRRADIEELATAFDAGLLGKRVPQFDASRGSQKGYSLVVHERHARAAVAECVGEIDRVKDLLQRVTTFGALRRRGRGLVDGIDVEPIHQANWERRYMPGNYVAPPGRTYMKAQLCLRAPYWDRPGVPVMMPVDC